MGSSGEWEAVWVSARAADAALPSSRYSVRSGMGHFDILIIGGGAAGIAAARAAADAGCKSIALVERKQKLGGILLQCSHPGFGAGLTGGEYAAALVQDFPETVTLFFGTTVLSVEPNKTAHLSGDRQISFSQLILATGSREIPLGALPIAGTRPKGVYTAGQMQEMMNLHGFVPQGPVVILGSGDIGLIMASQIAAMGISVTLVEQRENCGGLVRNRRCLKDNSIRLICSQTIDAVEGSPALTGCCLSGGEKIACRTLLIAAGLVPERGLLAELGMPSWLQMCGNCNTVYPMAEGVTADGRKAGIAAFQKIRGKL